MEGRDKRERRGGGIKECRGEAKEKRGGERRRSEGEIKGIGGRGDNNTESRETKRKVGIVSRTGTPSTI